MVTRMRRWMRRLYWSSKDATVADLLERNAVLQERIGLLEMKLGANRNCESIALRAANEKLAAQSRLIVQLRGDLLHARHGRKHGAMMGGATR